MQHNHRSRTHRFVLAAVLALLLSGCGLSSDSAVEQAFYEHKTEFEELRAMLSADAKLEAITDYDIRTTDTLIPISGNVPVEQVGITNDRWTRYAALVRNLELHAVIKDDKDDNGILFKIDAESILNGDSSKGLFYSTGRPKPVATDLDSYEPSSRATDQSGHFIAYKELKYPNWYLYLAR